MLGTQVRRKRFDVTHRQAQTELMILMYFIIGIAVLVTLIPFYWIVVSSFKTMGEIFSPITTFLPVKPTAMNYIGLFTGKLLFANWLLNSAITTGVVTLIGIILCSMAGFAFAKYRFFGQQVLFWITLAFISIPQLVIIVGAFKMLASWKLINTYWALILPMCVNPFGIFFMRQYIGTVPSDLLDVARIDGCSEFGLYYKIILPIIKPGLAALAIFLFLFSWNQYFWPLIMMRTTNMYTLTVGIATLRVSAFEAVQVPYGVLMAGSFLSILPIIMVFVTMQRHFVAGLMRGAFK